MLAHQYLDVHVQEIKRVQVMHRIQEAGHQRHQELAFFTTCVKLKVSDSLLHNNGLAMQLSPANLAGTCCGGPASCHAERAAEADLKHSDDAVLG